ncbi:MAG: ATPase [Propionibacteriaceae bacterium]|jgi:sugar (pentulose or hexulose) kinase|nr:ATPase [Propionibacteriaceae bacterium]
MTQHPSGDDVAQGRSFIEDGRTALGVEFGSTRIKAVLTGPAGEVLASGGHEWENQFADRMWTYSLEAVEEGLQAAYADLAAAVRQRYGVAVTTLGAAGISAMMHGYLAFDAAGDLLVPFRTWRNTTTERAATALTDLFDFTIPLRWSVAHVYQAILDEEAHVGQIASITTLAGYVHERLTGERVLGVGDASGMFPIDSTTGDWDADRLVQFDELLARDGVAAPWKMRDILPQVLPAGAPAGRLMEAGARLLDPTGTLQPGAFVAPPEGDAGTGMVATNAIAPRTGNVSAGTSIFAMIVLEHALSAAHPEIDMVTTPAGDPVAMVHCNNGASELNEWCGLFGDFAAAAGVPLETNVVFETLFRQALEGEADGGGLLAYNYLSGEPITGLAEGRPLVARTPDSRFTLPNFMRVQLYSAFATLKLGMNILAGENVAIDSMFAHGGLFKTAGVAQRFLAAAMGTSVTVGETASEGGAWGMAVLALYRSYCESAGAGADDLRAWLETTIFADAPTSTLEPDEADVAGFEAFIERYVAALPVEKLATEAMS